MYVCQKLELFSCSLLLFCLFTIQSQRYVITRERAGAGERERLHWAALAWTGLRDVQCNVREVGFGVHSVVQVEKCVSFSFSHEMSKLSAAFLALRCCYEESGLTSRQGRNVHRKRVEWGNATTKMLFSFLIFLSFHFSYYFISFCWDISKFFSRDI